MRCLLAACLLLAPGCTADNGTFGGVFAPDDGIEAGADAATDVVVVAKDALPASDAPAETAVDETTADTAEASVGLPEGSACTSSGPACETGLDCVQAEGFCSTEFTGACVRRPVDCSSIPRSTICSCDGDEFRSECDARLKGYTRVLVPCHTGSG
jgi:hypothetical protein